MAKVTKSAEKKRIYFAHPINTYSTALEASYLALIAEKFPVEHYTVVNPADQVHIDKVAELRKHDPKVNVMPYFEELTASCDEVIVLPFGDGMWGAGVWLEAEKMHAKNGWVWVINPTNRKVTFVPKIPEGLKLTVDETRARIRFSDGSSKPYE